MSLETAVADRSSIPGIVDLAPRLEAGLAALRLALPPAARRQLLQFLALLQQWNRVYNLTSVRDPSDALTLHLLDALSILPIVEARRGDGDLLDVGSGAGLPGIPLAIARPHWTIHSIDAVAKKIGFQIHAKQALQLSHFQPRHLRVEALTLPRMPSIIVARAYASLRALVESAGHLADEATTIVAMKGTDPVAEVADLPAGWRVSETLVLAVPFLGAERRAVLLKRD